MRAILLLGSLALSACGFSDDPVGIPRAEMYTLVCVDSTLVYPTYPCWQGMTIRITIENPFAPDTAAAP